MNRKNIKLFLIPAILFAVFLGFGNEARAATDYYISPTGTDSGNCTIGSPCATIAYASAKLSAGDTLFARGGTYTGQYSRWTDNIWKVNGSAYNSVIFKAYPGETPIFDGTGTGVAALFCFLNASNSQYIIIDGITIQNYYLGMWISYNSLNITIKNCTIGPNRIDGEHGIYLSGYQGIGGGPHNITIDSNYFKGRFDATQSQIGIHANQGATSVVNLKIYNNLFINWKYSATLIGAGAEDIEIYNNTLYNNMWGFVFGYYGDGVDPNNPCVGVCNATVKNNIIYAPPGNGTALRVGMSWDINDVVTNYNLYYNVSGNPIYWNGSNLTLAQYQNNTANGDHSFVADPKFVNPESDWHLQSGSPAIDVGVTLPEVTNDADGNSRPSGVAYDIGAYEYVGTPPDTTPPAAPTGVIVQ